MACYQNGFSCHPDYSSMTGMYKSLLHLQRMWFYWHFKRSPQWRHMERYNQLKNRSNLAGDTRYFYCLSSLHNPKAPWLPPHPPLPNKLSPARISSMPGALWSPFPSCQVHHSPLPAPPLPPPGFCVLPFPPPFLFILFLFFIFFPELSTFLNCIGRMGRFRHVKVRVIVKLEGDNGCHQLVLCSCGQLWRWLKLLVLQTHSVSPISPFGFSSCHQNE